MNMYPTGVNENLDYRIKLLSKANKDPLAQAIIIEQCNNDILFWINTFVFTYNPRLDDPIIPFITYKFQDTYIQEIIDCIEKGQDNITEKSRDMGYSWMILTIFLWGFLFKGRSTLCGSYKEDYVDTSGDMDSIFEKIRFVLERLPKWMKPNDIQSNYMSISSKELRAEISGDAGENFGTGGRRKAVRFDEFPLWKNDAKAFRKSKDVTNCRIFGGTPEGRRNVYGKIMTNHEDYVHMNMKKFRLHWRLHPLKDQQWYEQQKKSRTPLDLAKEIDISYDNSVTGAVYKDFDRIAHIGKYEFNPKLTLYTAWDFGLDTNALQFRQKDHKTNSLYMILSIKKVDWNIKKMYAFVTGIPTPNFEYTDDELEMIEYTKHLKPYLTGHYGDPYNASNRSTVTESTIEKELKAVGIHLQTNRKTTVEERIRKATLALPRIYVSEDELDFIHDITQSRYPQTKEGSETTLEKTKPIHDSCSHNRTAFEYFIDNEPVLKVGKRIVTTDYSNEL